MPFPKVVKRLVGLSAVEEHVLEAYRTTPEVADSDKTVMLAIWENEGLSQVLGPQHWEEFKKWFTFKATSPESLTRAGRRLRQAGVIKSTPEAEKARGERQRHYVREYGKSAN